MSKLLKLLLGFLMIFSVCHLPHVTAEPYLPYFSYPYSVYKWPTLLREPQPNSNIQRRSELIGKALTLKKLQLLQSLSEPDATRNYTRDSAFFRSDAWPFSSHKPNRLSLSVLNNRQKLPIAAEKDLARFLYIGAGNVNVGNSANYLFKTSYAFVSATATLCVVSTCIPANQFVSGYSSVTCRKKRSVEEFEAIAPSIAEPIQATAIADSTNISFPYYPKRTHKVSEDVLKPSFSATDEETEDLQPRKKRFIFVLTSTVTTYAFVTSTFTYRLSLVSAFDGSSLGYLTCRPSNVGIC